VKTTAFVLAVLLAMMAPATRPVDEVSDDERRPVAFDVAVTDNRGNPVTGLNVENFRIFEDDIEQSVRSVAPTEGTVAVVVLSEFTDSFGSYYDQVLAPTAGLLNALHPDDWIALVKFDVQPEIVTDFTRDRKELSAGLHKMQLPFYNSVSTYDALNFVLERTADLDCKTVIVLLGTGLDTIGKHGYRETLRKAETSDSMIYAIGMSRFAQIEPDPFGDMDFGTDMLQADNAMRSFAEATGGLSFFPQFAGEFRSIYQSVNADIRRQYRLEFFSTNRSVNEASRKLRVEVTGTDIDHDGKPDKLKVRHKKSYDRQD
jgi:VWFA-related protein